MKRLQTYFLALFVLGFVVTNTAACGDGVEGGGSGGGGGGSASSSSGTSEGCSSSFCGCWEEVTMTFGATVQDTMTQMPLAGIELLCAGEMMPIATSDATGNLSFSIQTNMSPGCGYERCNNMKLHDPTGMHADVEGTYFTLQGTTISM